MKMLVQRTAISANNPFSLSDLKAHLRVDHDDDDAAITNMGWTAAAEVENFAQIALLTQSIRVTIFNPIRGSGLSMPIGPVADGAEVTVTIDGEAFTGFDFASGLRPYLRGQNAYQLLSPVRVVIEYTAGFGDDAGDIPPDLAQAIMDQAALHYDGRSPMDGKALTMSPHMARIGARYRGVAA